MDLLGIPRKICPSFNTNACEHRTNSKAALQRDISDLLEPSYDVDDPILECGSAPLTIIRVRPEDVLSLAHEKLHTFPYKDVPECWRRLYTEATLWKIVKLEHDDWISEVVRLLDMAIILTGAPRRYNDIQSFLQVLQKLLHENAEEDRSLIDFKSSAEPHSSHEENGLRKRRRVEQTIPQCFPEDSKHSIQLLRPLERVSISSLATFERRIQQDVHDKGKQGPLPFIITGGLNHWPAINDDNRKWADPRRLLDLTLGGRRIVPVELGRSYTDEDWGQQIMTFGDFMNSHMLQDPNKPPKERKTGYLAQHDLFAQIPELRADIAVPDFCYANVPDSPGAQKRDEKPTSECNEEDEDDMDKDVMLNIWFGPAHTISPLHTDPHHNILAQVVGSKYVRLYAPSQAENVYPRTKEGEVDMSNTSQVDIDRAMKILEGRNFDSPSGEDDEVNLAEMEREKDEFATQFPNFLRSDYVEGILGPGECLFIPRGWWHFVRSLSASCSVSFWWD